MTKSRIVSTLFALLLIPLAAGSSFAASFPGPASKFHAFARYDFEHGGRRCIIVAPKKVAEGKPWIWRARFFGHEPQTDVALLERGYHVAYADVAGLFGSPKAVAIWDAFYEHVTSEYGFHKRPALEGMSRGGLIIYNWAKKNPGKVSSIYGDAPVCDINSWPGGKGTGKGSANAWKQCLGVYGFTEAEALAAKINPIDALRSLASARVPLLSVVGDADAVVPVAENTRILEARYRKLGGLIEVIHKPGVGHHPHSLKDPKRIVDFVLRNHRQITVILAGDSTVTDKAGWGAAFAKRFGSGVHTINLAKGGASSKNFRDAGFWKPVFALEPDFVLIQFGHNDMPGKGPHRETDPGTTYRENLERYVSDARSLGVRPILISPMTRRLYLDGKIASRLTAYAEGTRAVAAKTGTPLIDLHALSVALHNQMGAAKSAELGPAGDRTHFNTEGAEIMTDLILAEAKKVAPELTAHLLP